MGIVGHRGLRQWVASLGRSEEIWSSLKGAEDLQGTLLESLSLDLHIGCKRFKIGCESTNGLQNSAN